MAKIVSTEDYKRVIATAQIYADGLRVGSASSVATAFHKNATMFGVSEKLFDGSIDALYTFIDTHGPAPHIKTHLDVLAITPTTAVVRVDLEQDALGLDYTDFLTFIKIDGKWSVAAKVFHAYEAKK